jgi:hypothetical protein
MNVVVNLGEIFIPLCLGIDRRITQDKYGDDNFGEQGFGVHCRSYEQLGDTSKKYTEMKWEKKKFIITLTTLFANTQ